MTGAERIAAERQRQIDTEGWSADHDDDHVGGELAWAAVCYAAPEAIYRKRRTVGGPHFFDPWPWYTDDDKRPSGAEKDYIEARIRALEKAGALIAAEIDRLLRAAERSPKG